MAASKNLIWATVVLVILALAVAGYFYFKKSEPEGAVGAAEEATEAVPEIVTNPAENVPEVNPIDRANPFKYQNPLR